MGDPRAIRRAVVTGVGPITSIGTGKDAFWDGLVSGRRGTRPIDLPWLAKRFRCRVGAPVELPGLAHLGVDEQEARLLDPATQLALAASALALDDAGFRLVPAGDSGQRFVIEGVDPERAGVILGSGIGGLSTIERAHRAWLLGEPLTGSLRYSVPMLIPNAIPAQTAIRFGLRGECKTVSTACAAGTMAIGDAYRLVRDGELDLAIAGGVDKTMADYDGFSLLGFDLLNTVTHRNDDPEGASRPFDRDRDGFVMSEGAGIVVLESEAHARARGGRPYCEIAGYGVTCDAHSMMQIDPDVEQVARAMRGALEGAGLSPEEVGYVNAHGTATRLNDPAESRALRRVFGRAIDRVLVNSTKAMTGHAIGAAGGIEAIATVLSLAHGLVHRCVNLDRPDPECDIPLPRENAPLGRLAALSNSFAFGGHNAVLALVRS
jgi:3-oxoacyl-[acyl-carrier-protein] synthase II